LPAPPLSLVKRTRVFFSMPCFRMAVKDPTGAGIDLPDQVPASRRLFRLESAVRE
jgi:hypothetical protein